MEPPEEYRRGKVWAELVLQKLPEGIIRRRLHQNSKAHTFLSQHSERGSVFITTPESDTKVVKKTFLDAYLLVYETITL